MISAVEIPAYHYDFLEHNITLLIQRQVPSFAGCYKRGGIITYRGLQIRRGA